jgi:hypothetical protein
MSKRELMAVEMRVVGRLFVDSTRRWALTVVGFALVAVGIAGLVLPILPGWALIISGLVVLSREYSWADSALAFARRHAARGGRGLRDLLRRARRRDRPAEVVLPAGDVLIDLTCASSFEAAGAGPGGEPGAVRPPRQPQRESERSA